MAKDSLCHSTFGQQLQATLIRNVRLKTRDSRKTIAEVFLPLYTLATLILLKILIPNPNFPAVLHPTPHDPRSAAPLLFAHFAPHHNHTVSILPASPNGTASTRLFLDAVNDLWLNLTAYPAGQHDIGWQFYDTADDLHAAYWRDPAAMPLAVVFHGDDPFGGQLRYEIRTNPTYNVTPPTAQLFASHAVCRQLAAMEADEAGGGGGGSAGASWTAFVPIESGESCPANQYYYSGFVALQALLDYTKIRIASSNLKLEVPLIRLQMFPKAAFTGHWMVAFRVVIPIYMVMALSQFITYLLILIVGEKENHIKEGLKIMGLRDSVYWLAWFLIYAAFVTFLTGVSVVLLFSLGVFQHTHYLPVFILILLYSLSVILIGFMITPFFDNSRTAGILGNFAVNIMSLLYFIQVFVGDTDTAAALWLVSLISPTGFALAMDKILVLDIAEQGVTFDNLWQGPGIPLGGSILMMAADIVLYAALAFYLDAVVPSEHGVKQSPLFCVRRSYWWPRSTAAAAGVATNNASPASAMALNGGAVERDVEPVSRELRGREAIRIVDLHKSFQSCRRPEVRAVNGINLTIYEGQITAILGHNGAGKSTLFNILTGLTAPTSGTAYIFGYDIRDPNDMMMIRRMTGVCPQHDILFDQLTAREHLYFFAAVRGIRRRQIKAEVKRTLRDVDLHETAETMAKHLSGGQMRKLSVGCAIIGDPKIIILDEPTAGVDPYSRRHLWSILQQIKRGKVILLTTHFMDEADILADRKAVVSKGRLRCCGSSLFLKNKFGIGYHLTLVLDAANAREAAITQLVQRHVPQAERARRHGRELSYILPHDAVDGFAPLFVDIEREIAGGGSDGGGRMGISSYGVSMTTLEEVFLHLETQQREAESGGGSAAGASGATAGGGSSSEPSEDVVGLSKKMVRNRALSRSLSLQGKSGSYQSLHNNTTGVGLGAGLDDDCLMATLTTADHHSALPSLATSWLALDDIQMAPSTLRTLCALLKLRIIILLRDLQRLYLMILLPLGFTAIGLYLNSIQVIMPVVRSVALDADTYAEAAAGGANRLAVVDNTHNPDTADFRYIVAQLNASAVALRGDGDGVAANYSQWLSVAPHLGAVVVNGLSWSSVDVTAMYNDTAQHSLPIVLNLLSNAIYRMNVLDDFLPIEVRAHPFRQTSQPQEFNIGTFSTALFVGMMYVLIPVSLAVDMVYDREMKTKNQLRVNGLPGFLYFATYFIVLAGLMVVCSAALLGMVFLFDIPAFQQPAALLTLAVLLLLYCPAAVLCSTCFSYVFDRSDSAQSILPNVLTFVGLIPFVLVIFLDMLGIEVRAAIALHYLFSLLNPMYIPYAAVYFVDRVYVACRLSGACAELSLANYMTHEVLVMALGTLLHIPIWAMVLCVCDARKSGVRVRDALGLRRNKKTTDSDDTDAADCSSSDDGGGELSPGEFEDDDVRHERARVLRMTSTAVTAVVATAATTAHHNHHRTSNGGGAGVAASTTPVVLVRNLRKDYNRSTHCCVSACCTSSCTTTGDDDQLQQPPKVAVRSLTLAVEPGEVLGLLGHNGAGKTTTMKIMTGETAPSRGQVRIGGHNIQAERRRAFATLGYCPQHDALWKNITVREHLELYAAIRGVPRNQVAAVCATYLRGLHIEEHAGRQTQHCSGGTRRKLSYAMAMVGAPRVVLLDEPSTGMDPKSKRFLWDTILASFQGGRGAVLTTHSMEEADALCSRVGIMVKGELRCLGSTQHLKNLYGAGYTLEVKLKHIDYPPPAPNDSPASSSASSSSTSPPNRAPTDVNRPSAPHTPTTPTNATVATAAQLATSMTASSCPQNSNGDPPTSVAAPKHQQFVAQQQQQQPSSFDVACDERQERRSAVLRQFVVDLFPDACLEESFADRLVYSVPQHAVSSLAECFHQLERAKTELDIEEYSFSQTTLEQVFLKFAHYDEDETTSASLAPAVP